MDIICKIIAQGALQEREFTNRMGQPEKFASVAFHLRSGGDSFYVESVGDTARCTPQLQTEYSAL